MSTKRTLTFIIHPFLSGLILSFFLMSTAFLLENNEVKDLPFTLSSGESIAIVIFVSLFLLYPILILAFAIPSLFLEQYKLNTWSRLIIYIVLGTVCMLFNTVISKYDYLYLAIAPIFTLIDTYMFARRVDKNLFT